MADFADVNLITRKALQAVRTYYDCLDNPEKRAGLLNVYIQEPTSHPLMEWNGYAMADRNAVWEYLSNLPKTKHEMKSVDAQPLPGNTNGDSFFATVHGSVMYDDEHTRHFFQRFVFCVRADQKVYIANDYLRWTGEESA